jgi:chromosome segregation ATPase
LLTQHLQQQHAWRFRQLEVLTRVLSDMDDMADKLRSFEQIADTLATTLTQKHDQHQQEIQELVVQVEQWQGSVEVMAGSSSHMNRSIARLQQQMAAQQQRLLSADKETHMLQKQLEHVGQQLSMSNLTERKLRADLADEHLARDKTQAEAQQEVRSCLVASWVCLTVPCKACLQV